MLEASSVLPHNKKLLNTLCKIANHVNYRKKQAKSSVFLGPKGDGAPRGRGPRGWALLTSTSAVDKVAVHVHIFDLRTLF